MIGGIGALVILMFVFGTLPAVLMPIAVAVASILNTFTLIWALTYVTDVSLVVQFLIALVGLGVAIDYSLLMIFRYREELATGEEPEEALVETMTHAGRSVIVSGSTVAIGLFALVILPIPFLRSIGIGGMLIPVVSVLAAITLLPALLAVLGRRINSIRVMPKRIVEGQPEEGFWVRWARIVVQRPAVIAAIGLFIVGVLVCYGLQLNPAEAQAKDLPAKRDATRRPRRTHATRASAPACCKPFVMLVENDPSRPGRRARRRRAPADAGGRGRRRAGRVEQGRDATRGGVPRPGRRREADARRRSRTSSTTSCPSLPLGAAKATLGGVAPEDRDFVHAVYGKFPYVLLFVIVLTYVLLMRAFRSLILPLKAVVLNLSRLRLPTGSSCSSSSRATAVRRSGAFPRRT